MTYRKILVAVDTSDEADEVINAAKGVMGVGNTSISLVTVITPITSFYVEVYAALGDTKKIEAEAVAHATRWLSERSDLCGINADSSEVIIGTPAAEIKQQAKRIGADLIVIGTHGQHGLGLMLGSTANAVLHGAPCDVLAVRVRDDS